MKGLKIMKSHPDDPLLTNEDNLTLDELLEFCDTESSQEESLNNKKPDKPKTKFEKLIDDVDNRLSKVNEAVLSKSFFEYVLTPDGITSFSNYLISHLKNIDQYEEMVLRYFLQTAICYSSKFTEDTADCTLTGIISAAILLLRYTNKDPIDDTFFDYTIKSKLEECSDNSLLDLKSYYEQFCEVRNENSQRIILKNLLKIAKNYTPYTPKN